MIFKILDINFVLRPGQKKLNFIGVEITKTFGRDDFAESPHKSCYLGFCLDVQHVIAVMYYVK